jgi:predicted RNA-binding protein associated with RNAse of E/G family
MMTVHLYIQLRSSSTYRSSNIINTDDYYLDLINSNGVLSEENYCRLIVPGH